MKTLKILAIVAALSFTAKTADASVIIMAPIVEQPVCTQQVVMVPTMFGYVQQLQTVCQQQPVYAGVLGVYWLDKDHHRHYINHHSYR